MLTLREVRDAYEELSCKVSDVTRQLGFGAIAIIWIFNKTTTNPNGISELPQELILPLLLACIALACDLLQNTISTIIWYAIYLCKHKKDKKDEEIAVKDSEWINAISWILMFSKIVLTIWAYTLIAIYLFKDYIQ